MPLNSYFFCKAINKAICPPDESPLKKDNLDNFPLNSQ